AGSSINGRSAADENVVLTWYQPFKDDCVRGNTNGGNLDESAFNSCMRAAMKEVCGNYYNETPEESRDPAAVEICEKYTGDPEKAVESLTPQTKPSHGVEESVAAPTLDTPKGDAAGMESSPEVPAGDPPAKPTERPQSTSPATDTANNEAEKSREVVVPKNAPESNATGKREKENESKISNTNETTLKAEAMKNITTIGDSDGSTAASHTTFPLLLPLLVVVACAAAAAVVAA
ncbi:mucin-associated surface protein (MASP), putative, partial [Trypanosoma cruzi marinkellei]